MTERANNAENVFLGIPDQKTTGAVAVAPVGTTMPTQPGGTLNQAFDSVGFIDEDGILISGLKAAGEALREWGGGKVRELPGEVEPKIAFGMIEMTKEALALVVGEDNVSTVEANASHGNITKARFDDNMPEEHAIVIKLKDGPRRALVTIERALATELEDIQLIRKGLFKLKPTFSILSGAEGYVNVSFDDGKTVSSGS